jgi:hypothetical protein
MKTRKHIVKFLNHYPLPCGQTLKVFRVSQRHFWRDGLLGTSTPDTEFSRLRRKRRAGYPAVA